MDSPLDRNDWVDGEIEPADNEVEQYRNARAEIDANQEASDPLIDDGTFRERKPLNNTRLLLFVGPALLLW